MAENKMFYHSSSLQSDVQYVQHFHKLNIYDPHKHRWNFHPPLMQLSNIWGTHGRGVNGFLLNKVPHYAFLLDESTPNNSTLTINQEFAICL